MGLLQFLSMVLVLAGIGVMFAAIRMSRSINRTIPEDFQKRWAVIPGLLLFFLSGYIGFFGVQMLRLPFPAEFITGAIFFGGSLFVLLVFSMVQKIVGQMQEQKSRISQISDEIQQKNVVLEEEIRQRRRTEEELRQSTARIENIFNNAIPLCITNTDHEIILANDAYRAIWGDVEIDKTPVLCYDSRPGSSCRTRECPLSLIMEGEEEVLCELSKEDGPERNKHYLVTARPFRDADNRLVGVVESFQDITLRLLAEEALRVSEERFHSVYENSAIGITISNLEGRINQCNPAYRKMLGYSEAELLNRKFVELTHPEDVAGSRKQYEELLVGKRDYFQAEKRFVDKDGMVIWGRLTVSLVKDKNDQPVFVIGLVEDIRERMALESEQIRAGKLESISLLAGGIAHDFNNLLTGVMGNISLLRTLVPQESRELELLQASEKAALRAAGLTKQLLTFSKGGGPVMKTIGVESVIIDAAGFSLHGSSVDFLFDPPSDLWSIRADEGQLGQVIQNLVINAVQAMPSGGMIVIKAENVPQDGDIPAFLETCDYVKIEVVDQGEGIGAEDLTRVFDPYFTLKESGSGLGLSVVYSIIKSHGGHVSVSSNPGEGTVVTLYLPALAGEKVSPEAENSDVINGSGRILVMDDEEIIRSFVKSALESLGYEVTTASDGGEAVNIFSEALDGDLPFDAVVLDITVPGGMGGVETLAELLKMDPEVKALVSSGYSVDPVLANYQDYGFKQCISKPFKVEALSQVLHRLLATENASS